MFVATQTRCECSFSKRASPYYGRLGSRMAADFLLVKAYHETLGFSRRRNPPTSHFLRPASLLGQRLKTPVDACLLAAQRSGLRQMASGIVLHPLCRFRLPLPTAGSSPAAIRAALPGSSSVLPDSQTLVGYSRGISLFETGRCRVNSQLKSGMRSCSGRNRIV